MKLGVQQGIKQALGVLALVLPVTCLSAEAIDPSCRLAYEQARAEKLTEAVASLERCGASTKKPAAAHTLALYDRARLLDKLGRRDEAEKQLLALVDKVHFETGLTDDISGPGVWSRDPAKVKVRTAIGINRADLLLEIAWRRMGAKDYKAAMRWAERSAQHALTRYRPESEYLPMDRDSGCAFALRGFARAQVETDKTPALTDMLRGYIRGCSKLPVAAEVANQSEEAQKGIEALKQRFDAYQAEATRANERINQAYSKSAQRNADDPSLSVLSMGLISALAERQKQLEPMLKLRAEFLALESRALGSDPLLVAPANP